MSHQGVLFAAVEPLPAAGGSDAGLLFEEFEEFEDALFKCRALGGGLTTLVVT